MHLHHLIVVIAVLFVGPHKCSNLCNSNQTVAAEESVKHNPRAIPLLLKWKRLDFSLNENAMLHKQMQRNNVKN